jgi:hypothetical protein
MSRTGAVAYANRNGQRDPPLGHLAVTGSSVCNRPRGMKYRKSTAAIVPFRGARSWYRRRIWPSPPGAPVPCIRERT